MPTLVGRESWFVYGIDPAPHARTGHRTPGQEARRRGRPRRAARGGYHGSFRRGLDLLGRLAPEGKSLMVACDGRMQLIEAHAEHPARRRIELAIYPNPSCGPKGSPRSREAIARDRAMFPVDQLHALLRHTRSDYKRKTIAFGRRLNAVMERLFVTAVWRNFVKRRSERRPAPETPAMRLGLVPSL